MTTLFNQLGSANTMSTTTPPRPTTRPATPASTRPAPAVTRPGAGSTASTPAAVQIGIRQPRAIVPRVIMYAGEKFGKTSLAAFAPDPIILMVRDNGYDTLLSSGQVPAVRAAEVNEWTQLLDAVRGVAENPQGAKTLVIDGITGAERACHEHVCNTQFEGDWGERGFLSFHKGYTVSVTEWLKLLAALDRVQAAGITVIMLAHARMKAVKNPLGADYDRFEPDCHEKTWSGCAKWADAILFGKFHTIVDVTKRDAAKKIAEQKGKAIGGSQRVIFTQPHDAWVAGNRYGMESEIWLDCGPEQMWDVVMSQIRKPAAE